MRVEYEQVAPSPAASWALRRFQQDSFAFHWHVHSELELTLIRHGTGTRIVGNSIESYRPGDLALIAADVPHAYVSTPGTSRHEAVVIQFRRDFLGTEFFARPEFASVGRLLDAKSSSIAFPARATLIEQVTELGALAPAERTLALVRLLLTLANDDDARPFFTEGVIGRLGPVARRRIDAVCAFLQQAYAGPVVLAEIASVAHMSPAALSRFFRRAIGRTITDYVTELRVAAACQLLSGTDLLIAGIATRCGYSNLSNFNRRFRALKGMTPRAYRQAMAGLSIGGPS
jgi:AraC-like DNA-binding protein